MVYGASIYLYRDLRWLFAQDLGKELYFSRTFSVNELFIRSVGCQSFRWTPKSVREEQRE